MYVVIRRKNENEKKTKCDVLHRRRSATLLTFIVERTTVMRKSKIAD